MHTRKREQKAEETRSKLLKSARRSFADNGFAAACMDDLTAEACLTRGALYHNFQDKRGLLYAVIQQIDKEITEYMHAASQHATSPWQGFLAESRAYVRIVSAPQIHRIMFFEGPAVLGNPEQWPQEVACIHRLANALEELIGAGIVKPIDARIAARLISGAALSLSLLTASTDDPETVSSDAMEAFETMVSSLLR